MPIVIGFSVTSDTTPEDIVADIIQTTGASPERLELEFYGMDVFSFRLYGFPVGLLCPAVAAPKVWPYINPDIPPPRDAGPDEWFLIGRPGFVLGFVVKNPKAVHDGDLSFRTQLAQTLIQELSVSKNGEPFFAEMSPTLRERIETVLVQGLGRALADQVITAFLHGRPEGCPLPEEPTLGGVDLPPDLRAALESLQVPDEKNEDGEAK